MTGEVLKSFLVGLGFDVDDNSLNKFSRSIAIAQLKVNVLYDAVKNLAIGVGHAFADLTDEFEAFGYANRIITPLVNRAIVLRNELGKAYSAAGINLAQAAIGAYQLNLSVTKTKFAFEALYKSIGVKFFPLFIKLSEFFRKQIYANISKIRDVIASVVNSLFTIIKVVITLGERLWQILEGAYNLFVKLDAETNGWLSTLLKIAAAIELLVTFFSPLTAALTAVLLLYDDFKAFQEGRAHLFDWTKFIPVIDAVKAALRAVFETLKSLGIVAGDLIRVFGLLFTGKWSEAWVALKKTGSDILRYFANLANEIRSIGNALFAIGKWAIQVGGPLFGRLTSRSSDSFIDKLTGNKVTPIPVTPLGSTAGGNNAYSNQSNVNATLQSNITVTTNANPQQTADALSPIVSEHHQSFTDLFGPTKSGGNQNMSVPQ